jgi:hypothetical protein
MRDLSVGWPFGLESRGEHRLKGVADAWRIFGVVRDSVRSYGNDDGRKGD